MQLHDDLLDTHEQDAERGHPGWDSGVRIISVRVTKLGRRGWQADEWWGDLICLSNVHSCLVCGHLVPMSSLSVAFAKRPGSGGQLQALRSPCTRVQHRTKAQASHVHAYDRQSPHRRQPCPSCMVFGMNL